MATDEFGEKTELPTEHRRSEARRKGNVARSQDMNSASLMLAVALGLSVFGIGLLQAMGRLIAVSLKTASPLPLDAQSVTERFRALFEYSLIEAAPLLLLFVATAVFINVVQVGFMVTPEVLVPKLNKLNPLQGVKRIFSTRALMRLFGSLSKLVVVVALAAVFISSSLPALIQLSGTEPSHILRTIHEIVVRLAFQLALALMALALLDFGFQKWKHEQDLRMSKQEVREEMKQMEGDPQTRQRRKEAHRKLVQAREVEQVKTADVVVTNPTHVAVALKYDPEVMAAPIVVAKGMGLMAERIRRVAIEYGVPVIERKPLARTLYKTVKVGRQIPEEMFTVFAEIMAYVYRMSGRKPPELRG